MRIVTHNAFWFQGAPFEPDRPGPPEAAVFDGLVAVYRELAPDVLCIQEVQSAACAGRLAAALGMPASYCPGAVRPQYGGALLTRAPMPVVDWRSTTSRPDRMWQKVSLPDAMGGLVIANAHLPSNRHLSDGEAGRARLDELEGVIESGQRPHVICGDFNERPDGAAHRLLEEAGYRDAALLFGAGQVGASIGDAVKRVDYIWVAEGLAPQATDYRVVSRDTFAPADGTARFLSDHLPVTVTIDV